MKLVSKFIYIKFDIEKRMLINKNMPEKSEKK